MDDTTLLALTRALASGEPVFLPWRRDVAAAFPSLHTAIERFAPGDRPAGQACALWLRDHALLTPHESATRLLVHGDVLLGFYALANGQMELSSSHRRRLGARRPTQPAVVLTQIARHRNAPAGTGRTLLRDAGDVAARASRLSAATVLALDPYDDATGDMWLQQFDFRASRTTTIAAGSEVRRLWIPLQAD